MISTFKPDRRVLMPGIIPSMIFQTPISTGRSASWTEMEMVWPSWI
jgi:hypothetical protein